MTIKKQYTELHTFLTENSNKKVSTILPELIELMSRKNNSSGQANTFHKDADGNVIAIYCYYHKKWELVADVEYGAKAGTATGLNTMCKEGVSNWTKQQRAKKQAEASLLSLLSAGEMDVSEIGAKQAEIAEDAKVIIPRTDGHGTDELDELLAS
jgi:hypothetical protein